MTPERYQQIVGLARRAGELKPTERMSFLAQACAQDAELHRAVESHILHSEQAASFLENNAMELLAQEMAEEGPTHPIPNAAKTRLHGVESYLAPGVTLGGRYLLACLLGPGGLGAAFLAHDQRLYGAPVVIKVLYEDLHTGEQRVWFIKKFQQEIAALARIDHPGVVRALDTGLLPDGRTYLVMQYIAGVPLRALIPPQGMPLARATRLLRQIAQALAAAHAKGVFHRDLKPENIMVQTIGDEEHARLIDFGIATVLDAAEKAGIKTTMVVGTPAYMAPEQLRGKPTAASDIYALGVIAYEMVTGRRPFEADSTLQLLEMQRAGAVINPCALRADLPAAAQTAILQALAFQAADRPTGPRAFSEAFDQALTAEAKSPLAVRHWLLLAAILTVLVVEIVTWTRLSSTKIVTPEGNRDLQAVPADRSLNYSLLVQKNPKRRPRGQPFPSSGDIVFEAGDEVRLQVSSPQAGYLYVINESPKQTGGLPKYNVLFPATTINGGSAEISALQTIQLPPPSGHPENDWFFLDGETGVEKVWLTWSAHLVPELEAVKDQANPKNKGVLSQPGQIQSVAQYLASQVVTPPEKVGNETSQQTKFRSRGEVLIGLVQLKHH